MGTKATTRPFAGCQTATEKGVRKTKHPPPSRKATTGHGTGSLARLIEWMATIVFPMQARMEPSEFRAQYMHNTCAFLMQELLQQYIFAHTVTTTTTIHTVVIQIYIETNINHNTIE